MSACDGLPCAISAVVSSWSVSFFNGDFIPGPPSVRVLRLREVLQTGFDSAPWQCVGPQYWLGRGYGAVQSRGQIDSSEPLLGNPQKRSLPAARNPPWDNLG